MVLGFKGELYIYIRFKINSTSTYDYVLLRNRGGKSFLLFVFANAADIYIGIHGGNELVRMNTNQKHLVTLRRQALPECFPIYQLLSVVLLL